MRAVVMEEFGSREVLQVREVPDPEPPPGHVRIAVERCALNHVDVDVREGTSRFDIAFPHIPGLELVGRVDRVGEGVTAVAEGDRVMPYLLGGEVFMGVAGPGGFAEYAVAPEGQLVLVPDAVSVDDAAALQVAFGTAWHMLFTRGGLRIGESVLVNSVSSGIGSAAVQLARLAGAHVIGTSSSADKLDRARELGMDDGIDHTTEDVPARVMELTGGTGVDLVFEHVGGDLFERALRSLRQGGRLVTCGAHAGEVVPFDIIPFFRAQHSVIGSFVYSREELEQVLGMAARGQIRPLASQTFALEDIQDAFAAMEGRTHFGKILVSP